MAQENSLDAKTNLGHTSLHLAAMVGNIDAAKLLISMGADVDAQDRQGKTPLMYALAGGHYAVVNFFLGSDKKTGKDFIEYLDSIFQKQDINHQDVLGRTRLHYCAIKGDAAALKHLLEKGADKNIRDNQQMKALDYAQGMNTQRIRLMGDEKDYHKHLDELLEKSDINATDETGKTALHHMANNGDHVGYKYLISKGAKTDIKDKRGKTASDYFEIQQIRSAVSGMHSLSITPAPRITAPTNNTTHTSSSSSTPFYNKQ